jgi:hypothetical protein
VSRICADLDDGVSAFADRSLAGLEKGEAHCVRGGVA